MRQCCPPGHAAAPLPLHTLPETVLGTRPGPWGQTPPAPPPCPQGPPAEGPRYPGTPGAGAAGGRASAAPAPHGRGFRASPPKTWGVSLPVPGTAVAPSATLPVTPVPGGPAMLGQGPSLASSLARPGRPPPCKGMAQGCHGPCRGHRAPHLPVPTPPKGEGLGVTPLPLGCPSLGGAPFPGGLTWMGAVLNWILRLGTGSSSSDSPGISTQPDSGSYSPSASSSSSSPLPPESSPSPL